MIPILLLAAGQSSRMLGRDKLLEDVNGTPILRMLANRALSLGPTYVTLPHGTHPRGTVLHDDVVVVPVPNAQNGMSRSISAGVKALPDTATGVIIMPADMPDIRETDLAALKSKAANSPALIVRAMTEDAKPGHPIFFDRSLFSALTTLTGDRGAFEICKAHVSQTEFIPLNGQRARLDLDTPAEWENYRNGFKA